MAPEGPTGAPMRTPGNAIPPKPRGGAVTAMSRRGVGSALSWIRAVVPFFTAA